MNDPSNKTKIVLNENTNLIITDGSLHETNLDTAEKNKTKTKIMLNENTNLIITDGSLHETNLDTAEKNTLSGNISLIKTFMEGIHCVRY